MPDRWVLAVLLAALLLAGCGTRQERDEPLILATVYPYGLLLKQLAGDSLEVRTLVPPNASPHTYSAKPSDLKALGEADLIVANGYGLETNLEDALAARQDKLLKVEDLLTPPSGGAEANPHVWLSPRNLIAITLRLGDELQSRFPEHKAAIGQNTGALIAQLTALDARIRQERTTFAKTPIITWHDSFHWFFEDYGIASLGTVQSSPGKEPTAKELNHLADLIKANGVKAIYSEPQMNAKAAKVLAGELGLRVIGLDPLGYSYRPETILDVILNNWEGMKLGWQQP